MRADGLSPLNESYLNWARVSWPNSSMVKVLLIQAQVFFHPRKWIVSKYNNNNNSAAVGKSNLRNGFQSEKRKEALFRRILALSNFFHTLEAYFQARFVREVSEGSIWMGFEAMIKWGWKMGSSSGQERVEAGRAKKCPNLNIFPISIARPLQVCHFLPFTNFLGKVFG